MSLFTLLLTTLGFLLIGIPAALFPVLSWAVWSLENHQRDMRRRAGQ